ncbi:hypothetical protein C8R46DRAFT_1205488 [Mycena filopes]|nr:hypothetical protein C8R46DRAFT_1205488 [Mycena filopes]
MTAKAEPRSSQETASLVKRLAGPSTGKIDLERRPDQADINRLISDFSKGSKFYENEKKKDKELTKKIDNILHLRDELIKRPGVDLQKIEATLRKLESERDLSQTIVHFDLDSFFASVEVLNDPTLAGKPFIVGGSVVSTASYEARKYGVRSGMASFIAKKLCPQLVTISHGFSDYSEMSHKVMAICKRYDPSMCPAGCDEGYLNITAYCAEHDLSPDACVEHLRSAVFAETKLTVSAGIAPNTLLAKICSDKNKPNGQFHLPFNSEAVISFMRDLPIRRVPGIGRVSERLLESIGIKTCGDIYKYRATLHLMEKQFGLVHLLRIFLGLASNSVQPPQREERKSIGAERRQTKILGKLDEVCAELESDMEETQWTGRTITLKYKLDSFEVFTRAKSYNRWISKKEDLFAVGQELLLPELPLSIRLIGLRVTKLKDLREPNPSNGIKRFFEAANSTSPSKKRRLSPEHDELGGRLSPQLETDEPPKTAPTSSRGGNSDLEAPGQMHACPVCGEEVTTENQTLNEHLDLCLNRNVIRQAQGEVRTAPEPKQGDIWERWAKKPSGSKKRT